MLLSKGMISTYKGVVPVDHLSPTLHHGLRRNTCHFVHVFLQETLHFAAEKKTPVAGGACVAAGGREGGRQWLWCGVVWGGVGVGVMGAKMRMGRDGMMLLMLLANMTSARFS